MDGNQNKRFWALIKRLGMEEEEKYALVRSFSNGRTASFSALEKQEESRMLNYMQHEADKLNVKSNGEAYAGDKMRKKVISKVASYMGLKDLDMEAIRKFVLEIGYLKKDLNRYSFEELPKLVTQMEAIWEKRAAENRKEMKVVKD